MIVRFFKLVRAKIRKSGKKHLGECRAQTMGCYKCGKEGHFIKDNPHQRDDQKREKRKKTNIRVFTITQDTSG